MGMLKKGFSLMEIMIVVAIMGLLVAMSVTYLASYMEDARKGKTRAHLALIKNEITRYYSHTSRFPRSLDDLVDKPENDDSLAKKWNGPYFENGIIPKDGWDRDFYYELTPGGKHPYELYSYGKEGEEGPENQRINLWE
jgi:general secretion pathway protein G